MDGTGSSYVAAIRDATRHRGDDVATVFNGVSSTWAGILEKAASMAGGLQELGLRPGERVGVLAFNSDVYQTLYLAIPWAGGVIVPLNWRWSMSEIEFAMRDCAPRVLFVDDHVAAAVIASLKLADPSLVVVATGQVVLPGVLPLEVVSRSHPVPPAAKSGEDILAIFYTGGTTGRSKGVMLSHAGIVGNCRAMRSLGLMPDGAQTLVIAPLFHLGAGSSITVTMLAGGATIIDQAFDPARTLDLIEKHRITDAFLVPTMISMILDHPLFQPKRLASLRRIIYGASPISAQTLDRILVSAPHVDFYQGYGMTEVCCTATVLGPEYHQGLHRQAGRHRSAGLPLPGAKVRVVDPAGVQVPPGTVGEILIGGDTLMLGYWNLPDATNEVLRDGWMHSGDGGYVDESGLLYVVDRLKDMIVSGGENVYSAEVENALSRHPGVAQCAVIGVPDQRWGERVHAVIVPRPDALLSETDLIDHCRSLIGGFKCPRTFEFRSDGLPLSAAGKVLKNELRAKYWEGNVRNVA